MPDHDSVDKMKNPTPSDSILLTVMKHRLDSREFDVKAAIAQCRGQLASQLPQKQSEPRIAADKLNLILGLAGRVRHLKDKPVLQAFTFVFCHVLDESIQVYLVPELPMSLWDETMLDPVNRETMKKCCASGKRLWRAFFYLPGGLAALLRKIKNAELDSLAAHLWERDLNALNIDLEAKNILDIMARHYGFTSWRFDNSCWRFMTQSWGHHGLIKAPPSGLQTLQNVYVEDRQLLQFYVHQICPGRTTSESNAYKEIYSLVDSHELLFHSVLSLSTSYRRSYLPEEGSDYQRLHLKEQQHQAKAVKLLKSSINGTDAAFMLMMHYEVLNIENDEWARYTKLATSYRRLAPVYTTSQFFIAFNSVLARTFCKHQDDRLPSPSEYSWLRGTAKDRLTVPDGTSGVSPAVLSLINWTNTRISLLSLPEAVALSSGVAELEKSCSIGPSGNASILELTAHSYALATLIYHNCRWLGYVDL
ncbi:MAG: hypothetical protein M1814_003053 [Vezdaea aestivalis]|nr:MAG: hypothetical protein M1814_003053 [Vezdaea aestivalis]